MNETAGSTQEQAVPRLSRDTVPWTLKCALLSFAILVVAVRIINHGQWGIDSNQCYKWGNALQVAYPEFQITHRGAADTERHLFAAKTIVDVDTHENAVFSQHDYRRAMFSQDIFGRVAFPDLGRTAMTPYLTAFKGGTPPAPGEKEQARAQARSLPRDQQSIVLVELSRPLTEKEMPIRFENGQGQRYFLSGAPTGRGKPIYWWPGRGGCWAITVESQNCGPRIIFDDYRQWLAQFTENDEDNLRALGLDLERLRASAAEGKVYGFTYTARGRKQILDLLDKPEVRTARIIATVPDIDD